MGVERKADLLRGIVQQIPIERTTITLTDEEWQQVERMTCDICESIAKAIEQQTFVSQNVLDYTMANCVARVIKLNCDMFGYVGGEEDYIGLLIRHIWRNLKEKMKLYENKRF